MESMQAGSFSQMESCLYKLMPHAKVISAYGAHRSSHACKLRKREHLCLTMSTLTSKDFGLSKRLIFPALSCYL